ncbi:hypothetical protein BDZ91DRAFT_725895 [Kalaharituber pfeilii]|nr:hypothetical protein BDZ91DRAFT_725895 [Kalaharituber pfeilii]
MAFWQQTMAFRSRLQLSGSNYDGSCSRLQPSGSGLQLSAVDYSQWTTAFQVARFDAEGRWFTGTRTNPVEIQLGIDTFSEGIKALSSGIPLTNAVHRRSRRTMGTQASDVENNTEAFYNDGSNLCEGLVT